MFGTISGSTGLMSETVPAPAGKQGNGTPPNSLPIKGLQSLVNLYMGINEMELRPMKRILLVLVAAAARGSRTIALCLTVSLMGLAAGDAQAYTHANCPIAIRASSDHHLTKVTGTLARGIGNLCFGWLDMIRQPSREMKEGGNGLIAGVAKGIGHTLMRTFRGVGDIAMSPMPKAKDGTQLAKSCPLCMMESP